MYQNKMQLRYINIHIYRYIYIYAYLCLYICTHAYKLHRIRCLIFCVYSINRSFTKIHRRIPIHCNLWAIFLLNVHWWCYFASSITKQVYDVIIHKCMIFKENCVRHFTYIRLQNYTKDLSCVLNYELKTLSRNF